MWGQTFLCVCGTRPSHCCGLLHCGAQAPDAQAHGPSRSVARGIFPDRGTNPCPPHWQVDSQPLRHQGSPDFNFLLLQTELSWTLPVRKFPLGTHLGLVLLKRKLCKYSTWQADFILSFIIYLSIYHLSIYLCCVQNTVCNLTLFSVFPHRFVFSMGLVSNSCWIFSHHINQEFNLYL